MTTTAINWLLALAIVALYAGMQCLDGPSDHIAAQAAEQDTQDAIKNEALQARYARAASQMCGSDGWSLQADNTMRCTGAKP